MIGGRRPLKGRKPADRRVRVERPHAPYFRYTGPGQLVAKPAANAAADPERPGRRAGPRRSSSAARSRPRRRSASACRRRKALAIFSSDAISSSAYATEEILRVLVLAGAGALFLSIQVAIAIALLLAVVSVSYRQVCRAYPERRRRLRRGADEPRPDRRADRGGRPAHRLRDDGVGLDGRGDRPDPVGRSRRPTTSGSRSRSSRSRLITIANLRGLRESGNIFAVPTYLFVVLALAHRRHRRLPASSTGTVVAVPPEPDAVPFGTEAVGILLLLKAFAGGSVALTGVEAIANGVPAFKPPEAKNAANTMTAMAILLGDPVHRADRRGRRLRHRPTEEGGAVGRGHGGRRAFGDGSSCS